VPRKYPDEEEDDDDIATRMTDEVAVTMPAAVDEQGLVEQAYQQHGGRVNAIQDELKAKGVVISWRRVAKILDELGLPRIKKGRG
jgi:Flp pilus assembly CpaF family ATPase